MIDLIDFSNCVLSTRNLQYAGRAGEKRGIIYNNENWFLKFPKNTIGMSKVNTLSYVTSPQSEYIGSMIYKLLGYDVHDTILGICFDGKRYKVVCACKDFIKDENNEILIPYTALRNDTNLDLMQHREDSFGSASNLNEIIFQLDHNTVLSNIKDAKERFWDVVVIDMLINNNDRNEDNWGVIKYKNENIYKLAPIFDCGNSFYGKTDEERIKMILEEKDRLTSSALNGITAYEDDEEKRISILNFIRFKNEDFKKACNRVYKKVNEELENIEEMILSIPESFNGLTIMTENRKRYYIETFKIRINNILKICF